MKFLKKFSQSLISLSAFGLALSACAPESSHSFNEEVNEENALSFSVPQIGSLNYLLEPIDTKSDSLNLLIEPLIKVKPNNSILPFLTNKNLNVRHYNANDGLSGFKNAIDFNPEKIKKDKDGFWDPTTDPNAKDTFDGEGVIKWKPLNNFYAGAADVIVSLAKETPLYSLSQNSATKINNRIIRFHIRDNLFWSNGDQVKADDYVTTLKYILDPARGAVEYGTVVNFLQILNSSDCYNERYNLLKNDSNLTGDQTWEQATSCHANINPIDKNNNPLQNSGFGVRALANNWVEYEFNDGETEGFSITKFDTIGQPVFLPVSDKFIHSLNRGILDFGLSSQNFLTNGAFNLEEFSPEYILKGSKNFKYWDQEDVFSHKLLLRNATNTLTQVNLFRSGNIAEISSIPPQFLPILNADPQVNRTVKRGGRIASSSFLQFSASGISARSGLMPFNDPDFRRALYYGLNRVTTLEIQNFFGLLPSGITIPNTVSDFPSAGDYNLYSYLATKEFRPDYPNASAYKFEEYNGTDRAINNFANYLGKAPVDNVFKPKLAKQFFARFVKKYGIINPTFPFQFAPTDEALAITLKQQWEELFKEFNFTLELEPVLSLSLSARVLIGDYTMIFRNNFSVNSFGTSSFNWYFPYTTTTFSNDRRFASQTNYFGDTIPAYARRLATTENGKKRLLEFGLDPSPYSTSQASSMWKLLQTLDSYLISDPQEFAKLPNWNEKFKNASFINSWKNPEALAQSDPSVNYIFRVGLGVGNNINPFFYRNGLVYDNPINVNVNNDYGINNAYKLADFFVILEKLMRDNVFSIPINSYAASYFATRLVGTGAAGSYGFPRNLTNAYRYDLKIKNSLNKQLPGEEILFSS